MTSLLNLDRCSDLDDGRDVPEQIDQQPDDVGTQARCQIVLRTIPGLTTADQLAPHSGSSPE